MKIVVDADAQPCKTEILEIAQKHSIELVFVMSVSHFSEKYEAAILKNILVDNRRQEADIKIMNITQEGDIAITQDTGLALFLEQKGVRVLNSRGKIMTKSMLEEKMEHVHIEKQAMRAKTGKRAKITGPAEFTNEDKTRLLKNLEKLIKV